MRTYKHSGEHGHIDVAVYDNVAEWSAVCGTYADRSDWRDAKFEGAGIKRARALMIDGVAEAETKMARDLIDKVDAHFSDRQKYKRVHSYVGARVHVGKMLGGSPKCVVRRKRISDDFAPVKVVVEIQVSAGMTEWALAKRGAAVAALTHVMAKERPVELWIAAALGNRNDSAASMVRVSTTPLSISQMLALCATKEAARRLSFIEVKRRMNTTWTGGWAFNGDPTDERRNQLARDAFRLKPQDIFIAGGYLTEQDAIISDPVAWVNKQLADQRGLT